jgi:hypothetical protein
VICVTAASFGPNSKVGYAPERTLRCLIAQRYVNSTRYPTRQRTTLSAGCLSRYRAGSDGAFSAALGPLLVMVIV